MVYLPSAVAALAATATRVVRGIPRVRCPRTRLRAHPLRRLCAPVPVDLPLRVPVLLPSCHARRLAIWTQWLDAPGARAAPTRGAHDPQAAARRLFVTPPRAQALD